MRRQMIGKDKRIHLLILLGWFPHVNVLHLTLKVIRSGFS